MLRVIATHVLSIGTIAITFICAGNIEELPASPTLIYAILIILFISVLTLAVIDVAHKCRSSDIEYSGDTKDEEARNYMTNLVTKNRGRCAISSNNLSWVTGDALEAMLTKAEQDELEIIMPKENAVSRQLANAGAHIHYYGEEEGPLESRFTIVNFQRSGQWAAVSHQVNDVHIIRKIRSGNDPTLYLAMDLFRTARRHAAMRS